MSSELPEKCIKKVVQAAAQALTICRRLSGTIDVEMQSADMVRNATVSQLFKHDDVDQAAHQSQADIAQKVNNAIYPGALQYQIHIYLDPTWRRGLSKRTAVLQGRAGLYHQQAAQPHSFCRCSQ